MSLVDSERRVLSGMRPTGPLHLGHYHGVLKNWTQLQHSYQCFFCIADWHALSVDQRAGARLGDAVLDVALDWLAAGVSPSSATLFVQSQVPEHAELHLLLSMVCPLDWLQRLPSCPPNDALTYGRLGYPLLQAADILLYRAGLVPVGGDQLAHVAFARELAQRFNQHYGCEPDFEAKAEAAMLKLGKKTGALYRRLRSAYQLEGDDEALNTARALLKEQQAITLGDRERLFGYLEGGARVLLPEPQALIGDALRLPGLDGLPMSRSADNAIFLSDSPAVVEEKIQRIAVVADASGESEACRVWQLRQAYAGAVSGEQIESGCRAAGGDCQTCKAALIETINAELAPLQARGAEYRDNPLLVQRILADGAERARSEARDTLVDVRQALGLNYR